MSPIPPLENHHQKQIPKHHNLKKSIHSYRQRPPPSMYQISSSTYHQKVSKTLSHRQGIDFFNHLIRHLILFPSNEILHSPHNQKHYS